MKHASLFSGIGGFDLAAEWMGWENVFHCEINRYGASILKSKWPNSIQYNDITKADFTIHRGAIDVLTGGFPCQDASNAMSTGGGQQGLDGARTGLFFEMCRAIREIRPKFVVAENVANILSVNGGKDFGRILTELSSMGYNAEWRICYASEQGAAHKRARLYLVAYSDSIRLQKNQTFLPYVEKERTPFGWNFAGKLIQIIRAGAWNTQPPIPVLADGVPSRLVAEQIKAVGNSIVPQIAHEIFKAIEAYDKQAA